MPTNYKQLFAIQKKNEEIIKQQCRAIDNKSGIYCFYRINENQEKCAYIGQAKNLLRRCASHLSGRKQHIDLSLYKHKFLDIDNPNGWNLILLEHCSISELDKKEQKYINEYFENGFKVYNVQGGGKNDRERDINERNLTKLKSYANGKQIGYEKARKEIALLFTKYLTYDVKKANILSQKAKEKFEKFLKGANENE